MKKKCVEYFKNNRGFDRAFKLMLQKWRKYGRAAGSIVILKPSEEEREAFRGFFGGIFMNEEIKFKMQDFERTLGEIKFSDISLKELLEEYFSCKLQTNKKMKEIKYTKKREFLNRLYNEAENTDCSGALWMNALITEKKYGYNLLIGEYEKSEEKAYNFVKNTLNALKYLNSCETKEIRLAVLGAEITANPHYFDRNTVSGRLLIWALSYIKGRTECRNAEEILELYYLSGIKPDDISSTVALYGISMLSENGPHPGYEEFIKNKESYIVTMSNLNRIKKADCIGKKVFIFENQAVFSHMCEVLKDLPVSLMCTSGQLKTAALIVIDMLCASGCILYYSGDIDPEGLGIADKLLSRSKNNIVPWRFTKDDYEKSISNEIINQISLKKLEGLTDPRLIKLGDEIKKMKLAGYQEMLMDDMAGEVRRSFRQFGLRVADFE
ncbi:MAG: TIGR02679 domain-containing protein [Tissierellia bacterium]|nr:TIGR02679 domain-containing protein [Tissierellia bacterium]